MYKRKEMRSNDDRKRRVKVERVEYGKEKGEVVSIKIRAGNGKREEF